MDFEAWMKETFDEPEWDEGYTRADMQKAYEATKFCDCGRELTPGVCRICDRDE